MKNIKLNSIKKAKTSKMIFTSFAVMVISAFTINMIGCSESSNNELQEISLQKRGGAYEKGSAVGFYKNAMGRINGNSKRLYGILKHHSVVASDVVVTQELLNDIQNETDIVFDLPLEDINQILQGTLGFMAGDEDLITFIGNLGFSSAVVGVFNEIVTNQGVENLNAIEGFTLLTDDEKDFLDLSNFIVSNPGSSYVSNGCTIDGVPAPCSVTIGLIGAGFGFSIGGPIGGAIGGVIGVAVGSVVDKGSSGGGK